MPTPSITLQTAYLPSTRRRRLTRSLIALLLVSPSALADPPRYALSFTAALHLAVQRSRQLSAHEAALTAARERRVAAGRLPDPVLEFGLDSWPVTGSQRFSFVADDFTMARIAVSQEWTGVEKRALRVQRFDHAGAIIRAEQAALIAAIERETAIAWFERFHAEALTAALAEQRVELESTLVLVEGAYRGGRDTQSDLIAVHRAIAELDDRASVAERRLHVAKTTLARWVGDRAELPLTDAPAVDVIRLVPDMLEVQLAHHPEVAVLTERAEFAGADARLAHAERRADWRIELAYGRRDSFSDMMSVNLSIPLQWDQANRQDREVNARLALAEQAAAERDEAIRAHVSDVEVEIEVWENGRERLSRHRSELMPLAQARTEALLAAHRGGTASAAEILLARRDEIDLRVRMIELELEIARAWARLDFLLPHITSPEASSGFKHLPALSEAAR